MKKLLTLLTALILLFGMAACTVTENNSSEPPASSEAPTSSDAPASSDVTSSEPPASSDVTSSEPPASSDIVSSEPPASSVVTPSNLPFVPKTEMGGFGRNAWTGDILSRIVWENETIYYIYEQKAIFSTASTRKIYEIKHVNGFISDLILYDGYIYFVEESGGYNYLIKIKTDGSNKTILCKSEAYFSDLFIYEGYLYYKFVGGTGYDRYKIKIDGSEPEEKTDDFSPLGNGWIFKPGKLNPDFTNEPGQFICGDEVFKEEDVWHGEYRRGYSFFNENIFYYDSDLNQFVFYNIRNTENKTFVSLPVVPRLPMKVVFISNWIFYINENNELCKIDIEGNGYKVLTKDVDRFEVCGEQILFFKVSDSVGSVRYDGTKYKFIR